MPYIWPVAVSINRVTHSNFSKPWINKRFSLCLAPATKQIKNKKETRPATALCKCLTDLFSCCASIYYNIFPPFCVLCELTKSILSCTSPYTHVTVAAAMAVKLAVLQWDAAALRGECVWQMCCLICIYTSAVLCVFVQMETIR